MQFVKLFVDLEPCLLFLFQVRVHFIDYGNTEVITKRSMVFLSQDLLSSVPYAQLYRLDGLVAPKDPNSDLLYKVLYFCCLYVVWEKEIQKYYTHIETT